MDAWVESVKKYGPLTGLVLLVPFTLPYLDKYMESQSSYRTEAFVQLVKEDIVSEISKKIDAQTAEVRSAHGRKLLNDKEALYLMRTAVGYQSIYKVEWLKKYLSLYRLEELGISKSTVRTAIKAELVRQSNIYVDVLNSFQHPKLGSLGAFVAKEFPMDMFLEGLYLIVESSPCLDCDILYDNVMYYMLDAQNDLWRIAEKRMK